MKRFSARISLFTMIAIAILCLVGCATTTSSRQPLTTDSYELPYESTYELVGYKFMYKVDDGSLTFNYIDSLSDAEIKKTAETIMSLLPQASAYEVALPGQMRFTLSTIPSKAQFDAFVVEMNKTIHDSML